MYKQVYSHVVCMFLRGFISTLKGRNENLIRVMHHSNIGIRNRTDKNMKGIIHFIHLSLLIFVILFIVNL